MTLTWTKTMLAAGLGLGLMAAPASAVQLRVTVTNLSPENGVTITPLWGAFHDGSFDLFTTGEAASAGLQEIAETGSPAGLDAALGTNGVSTFVTAAGNGIPPIEPGESDSAIIDVDGNAFQYFSYASMILPSNDQFIGNGNPFAFTLFDAAGNYLGDQTIGVFGTDAYDAGTEQNITDGAPFVPSLAGSTRVDEGGVVTTSPGIDNFAGLTVANGSTIDLNAIQFAGNPDYQIAQIQISAVPVPAALPLLLGALGVFGLMGRRKA